MKNDSRRRTKIDYESKKCLTCKLQIKYIAKVVEISSDLVEQYLKIYDKYSQEDNERLDTILNPVELDNYIMPLKKGDPVKKEKTTYKSLKHKSFRQALIQMLENDFSLLGSGKILELLADNMIDLIEQYMPERTPSGKTVISAISKNAPKGHHRGVKGLPQVPVTLDIYTEDIVNRYANNERTRDIKRSHVIDLFKQAFEQGGVLSSADVAVITKMSAATVSKYVRDHMNECDEIVPTRGFIHDIGPSISHKGIIVGKYLQGMLPDQIARETNHSLAAVERYIKDYERVRICLKQGMDTAITARATGLSKMLVLKHEELYKQYEGKTDDKNDNS